jgi:hypothetical protein
MASLSISLNFGVFVSIIDDIILVASRNYKYCEITNLLVHGGVSGGEFREILVVLTIDHHNNQ